MSTPNFTRGAATDDPRERARLRQHAMAGAIPIRKALPIVSWHDARPQQIALVFADLRARPDIRDLVRLHQLEGAGDIVTEWRCLLDADTARYRESLAILHVAWSSPARAVARFVFRLWGHRPLLHLAAASGSIAITGAPPRIPSPKPYLSLTLSIRATELRAVL